MGGRDISKGDRLLLVWASATPTARAAPPSTTPTRSFSTGSRTATSPSATAPTGGLGSNLARRQIQVALRAVLRRLPDYTIDHDNAVRAETVGIVFGMFSLPAHFPPAERWFS